jgi:hypothetical protein
MDDNMVHQQNLAAYAIAVLVLRARSNRIEHTQPLMSTVLNALPHVPKGERTIIAS